mgnify:CR=1 FL=1
MRADRRGGVGSVRLVDALDEGAGADVDVGGVAFRPAEREHRRGLVAVNRRQRNTAVRDVQRAPLAAGRHAARQEAGGQSEQREQLRVLQAETAFQEAVDTITVRVNPRFGEWDPANGLVQGSSGSLSEAAAIPQE